MPVSETFPPSIPNPSGDDYGFDEEPKVRKIQFEDGYEQRAVRGLNARPRKFPVHWPNLNTADKDTIIDFLRARNGSEAFFWTPPLEANPIKVKCPKWGARTKSGPWWTVTVTFEEVFDQ